MAEIAFFDQKLLSKYNTSGPRYTSYPTALEFNESFESNALTHALLSSPNSGLSLYVHIPFCHSLCYYCGCNKIVTRHQHKADIYLDYLSQEIQLRAEHCQSKIIRQLHFGGGTPSFLSAKQFKRVMTLLRESFVFDEKAEISIEVDPRQIELSYADELAQLGFNRLSIGVQDTDQKVQQAINRPQSFKFTKQFIARAKKLGFESVNIDLIYGLPHQTLDTFARTLEDVSLLACDRISLFSYAHLPKRFAAQRKINQQWLPSAEDKFSLMKLAVHNLNQQGYQLIGMDHFAKADDELAIAQKQGQLHRNFQGYTTHKHINLLGLGVSSISSVDKVYSQNSKQLKQYYSALQQQHLPTEKGLVLTEDDLIRQYVISELMCNLYLDKNTFYELFKIGFNDYFTDELDSLKVFESDNLLSNTPNELIIAERARLLVRNICMSFDAYMQQHIHQQRFSRVI